MAAVSQSLGTRFVCHFRISSAPSLLTLRVRHAIQYTRAVHASVYDKNVDDQVRPTMVPDEAVTQPQPEKYWAPHPKTGIFGPSDEQNPGDASGLSSESSAAANASRDSVLEEKAFYRPLEDLDKPEHP